MFAGCSAALAGDFKRFEVQPFGGYVISGSVPMTTNQGFDLGSIHVDSAGSAGVTFAVNINESDAIEALWQRQFSHGRLPGGLEFPLISGNFDLKVDQTHLNFLHHYELPNTKALPYVLGGLGVTTYRVGGNGQSASQSYFSFSLGGGAKYFFTNHFGIRGEARWTPTLLSASNSNFWVKLSGADSFATVRLQTSLQHQMDMSAGFVFRF